MNRFHPKQFDRFSWRQHKRKGKPRLVFCLCCVAVLAWAMPVGAVTHLKRGDVPSKIQLQNLDGQRVSINGFLGKPVVLLFGELYHTKTITACGAIQKILDSNLLADREIALILIVSQKADAQDLKKQAQAKHVRAVTLHDVNRSAFEDYRVAVIPSVVILDKQGKVVYALAALTTGFSNIITNALLLAVGEIDAARFEQRLHPPQDKLTNQATLHAQRLTKLADQLFRRGLDELAATKYAEALVADPNYVAAQLGLGRLFLRQRRLTDAEKQFRAVLANHPQEVDACLGLAFVQTFRGGEELTSAEQLVRRVLANHPSRPRGHYLLGLIYEQRDQLSEAVASFKKAAQLLMSQRD